MENCEYFPLLSPPFISLSYFPDSTWDYLPLIISLCLTLHLPNFNYYFAPTSLLFLGFIEQFLVVFLSPGPHYQGSCCWTHNVPGDRQLMPSSCQSMEDISNLCQGGKPLGGRAKRGGIYVVADRCRSITAVFHTVINDSRCWRVAAQLASQKANLQMEFGWKSSFESENSESLKV